MKRPLKNPFTKILEKLRSIKADPRKICYSFAFGVFMSTTPFIGFKWLVALPVILLLRWNKVACMLGILQVNYLTGPFFYAFAFFLGSKVCGYGDAIMLPERMNFGSVISMAAGNPEIILSLLTGGLILGIPLSLLSYYLVKSVFSRNLNSATS